MGSPHVLLWEEHNEFNTGIDAGELSDIIKMRVQDTFWCPSDAANKISHVTNNDDPRTIARSYCTLNAKLYQA